LSNVKVGIFLHYSQRLHGDKHSVLNLLILTSQHSNAPTTAVLPNYCLFFICR